MPADGNYTATLLGLAAGATSHVRVRAAAADGSALDGDDLTVACPILPSGMPSFSNITGTASPGYLLVSVYNALTNYSVATVLDRNGRIYWYRPQSGLGDFDRTVDGHFVSYDSTGYQVLALDSSILATYTDPLANHGVDNHEFVSLANGHAIVLGQNLRTVDTTGYTQPGDPNAVEVEDTIAELDGNGGVLEHFALGDQITLAETTPDIDLHVSPIDAMHANSIGILADDNLLLSLRHTDTVYKLDRTDGTVLWRLGGTRSDFSFANDSLDGFSHQHFARQLGNGDILLFDDGNLHEPPLSRVVEYVLDQTSHTATLVWEYRRTDILSTCCGSTTRLDSGHTLTAWGSAGVIDEVDATGAQVWQLAIPAAIVYRSIPVATLYP